jgi:hypothetical protein
MMFYAFCTKTFFTLWTPNFWWFRNMADITNLYCKGHERPCCRICNLENHKVCKNVAIMEEIIKNVKTSSFAKLWCSMHSVQIPSSQSGHQTSDGLEIWRISHIPQKDGEVDMMLISCNILIVLTCRLTFIYCHQSIKR